MYVIFKYGEKLILLRLEIWLKCLLSPHLLDIAPDILAGMEGKKNQ